MLAQAFRDKDWCTGSTYRSTGKMSDLSLPYLLWCASNSRNCCCDSKWPVEEICSNIISDLQRYHRVLWITSFHSFLAKVLWLNICGTLSLFLLKTYWKNLIEETGCRNFNKSFFSPPICLIRCFSIEGVLTKGCADGRENIWLFD